MAPMLFTTHAEPHHASRRVPGTLLAVSRPTGAGRLVGTTSVNTTVTGAAALAAWKNRVGCARLQNSLQKTALFFIAHSAVITATAARFRSKNQAFL